MCDVYAILSRTCTDSNKLHVGQDYIKEVLGDLGELHFGEMCMKPGKPSTFATVKTGPDPAQKKLFFGLPGNPVSCFVTFNLLVAPAIQRLRGSPGSPVYPRVDVELASPVQMDPVRPEYHRARARWQSGRIVAESTGFQRSSRIASIAEARTNCLLEIPKAHGTLTKGTVVKALLLTGLLPEPEGFPSIAARSVQAPLAPQAPSASGDAAPRRAKVALLRWDSAGGEVTREQLATFLGPVELIEKQAPEVLEMRELLESWSQESSGMDLILVLGNFGLGAKDENILALLSLGPAVMQSMGFDLSEDDVQLLGNMYCDLGDHWIFNYVDFLKSVDICGDFSDSLPQNGQGEDISHYFDARGKVIPHESAILA
eukprot:g6601.t1